ncbi:MAG: hypothetical protein JNL43_10710 [Flavobacteriales bacterium]|nr:hypothetical protein [Flavobacteriales bacterium]
MPQRPQRALSTSSSWFLALAVVMLAFLLQFYGHVLQAPNSVLLTSGGDGLKNYFTYAWHIEHDEHLLHYGGSGYPYGEHVFFTDGHPLLSWVFQLLPFLAPWKIGVLNTVLILGIAGCAFCLFALLRRFGVAPWACFVGAFSITLLQPQILRLGGHLSLAHCWFIPLTWYLLLRTRASDKWLRGTMSVCLVITAAFLTHPYLGLMNTMFVAGYYGLLLVTKLRSVGRQKRTWSEPLIMVLVPLALFLLLMNGSDVNADRPATPGGADIYATRFVSLIVASQDPFVTPLSEFFRYERLEWESLCYLGLSSLLILVMAGAVQVDRWAGRSTRPAPQDELPLYMGSAFLVLLFAMGEWQRLLGYSIPMLAQFRGTGRFAWVFFHVCTVFCTVRVYQYLFAEGLARKAVAVAAFTIVIGFYAVEGWAYHRNISKAFGHSPDILDRPDPQQAQLIEAARKVGAQAIVPLPYLHVGSERYVKGAPEPLQALSFPVAYGSALPLMAGITSRASLGHTRDLLAITSPPAYTKDLAKAIAGSAPFVLLRSNDELDMDEQQLWDRGKPLFQNEAGALRTITREALFASNAQRLQAQFNAKRSQMHQRGPWWFSTRDSLSEPHLFSQTFTAADHDVISGVARDYNGLRRFLPGELDSALTYEASFQFEAVDPGAVNLSFILEHTRPDETDGVWELLRNVRAMPMQVEDAAIVTLRFRPIHPDRAYKLLFKGPDASNDRYKVTNFVLRPLQVDAWREGAWNGQATLFYNNVPLTVASRGTGPSGNSRIHGQGHGSSSD